MKRYLLLAGSYYYPQPGTDDWIETFESKEEAKGYIVTKEINPYLTKYIINNEEYDWYYIVDLEDWI